MNRPNEYSDPPKKLSKQGSLSYIEQSLRMLSTPQEAPVTIYPGPKSALLNLSKADLEIAERLQKLRRKSSKDVPSEEEMAVRLAQLKGLPKDHYTKSILFKPPDSKTQVEKADDLFAQVAAEVALEAKCTKPEDEIEEQLSRLRSEKPGKFKPSSDDQDSYLSSLDKEDVDFDEIAKLSVYDHKKTVKEAKRLGEDAELAAAIAEICEEVKAETAAAAMPRNKRGNNKDEERFSASDSDDNCEKNLRGADEKEEREVERIVEMYKEKARIRSERKKKRKLEAKEEQQRSSDSSSLSSESDILTSESEKLSDD